MKVPFGESPSECRMETRRGFISGRPLVEKRRKDDSSVPFS